MDNHQATGSLLAPYRILDLPHNPMQYRQRAPLIGEHNEYIYKELLGMTDDEIADYITAGSITTGLPEDSRFGANM